MANQGVLLRGTKLSLPASVHAPLLKLSAFLVVVGINPALPRAFHVQGGMKLPASPLAAGWLPQPLCQAAMGREQCRSEGGNLPFPWVWFSFPTHNLLSLGIQGCAIAFYRSYPVCREIQNQITMNDFVFCLSWINLFILREMFRGFLIFSLR